MTQSTDRRRAIENALRSIGAPQDVATLILDNHDQAISSARQEGHEACADKVLAHLSQFKGHGEA